MNKRRVVNEKKSEVTQTNIQTNKQANKQTNKQINKTKKEERKRKMKESEHTVGNRSID
jgi:hypothetical protein